MSNEPASDNDTDQPKVRIHRALFQQYPPALRAAYATAIQDDNPRSRHGKLMNLGEATLAYLASVALSDYRSRRHTDPDPKVEAEFAKMKRLSLGHYLQIFRSSTEAMQPALFDYKTRAETDGALAIGRFLAAYTAIEDAIALEANNLRRLVTQRMEQAPKGTWLAFWEK